MRAVMRGIMLGVLVLQLVVLAHLHTLLGLTADLGRLQVVIAKAMFNIK